MKRRILQARTASTCDRLVRLAVFLVAIYCLVSIRTATGSKPMQQQPGKQVETKIGNVRFVIPEGFKLQQSSDARLAVMRHAEDTIMLFVALPKHEVDGDYLIQLSASLALTLLPQESGFRWKAQRDTSVRRLSKHQIGAGVAKGMNTKHYLQTDYVVVRAQGEEVVLGSIVAFGNQRDANWPFDVEGREYSFVGWGALYALIPSVTGEKPDE